MNNLTSSEAPGPDRLAPFALANSQNVRESTRNSDFNTARQPSSKRPFCPARAQLCYACVAAVRNIWGVFWLFPRHRRRESARASVTGRRLVSFALYTSGKNARLLRGYHCTAPCRHRNLLQPPPSRAALHQPPLVRCLPCHRERPPTPSTIVHLFLQSLPSEPPFVCLVGGAAANNTRIIRWLTGPQLYDHFCHYHPPPATAFQPTCPRRLPACLLARCD